MTPVIQAHFAPVKNPAPSKRPRTPKMMTMYASSTGPVPIPERREAAPNRESKPPAAATIDIAVTPTGRLGFEDCITPPRSLIHVISLRRRRSLGNRICEHFLEGRQEHCVVDCCLHFPEASWELWGQIARAR